MTRMEVRDSAIQVKRSLEKLAMATTQNTAEPNRAMYLKFFCLKVE